MTATVSSRITGEVVGGAEVMPALADDWERVFQGSGCEPTTSFEWTQGLIRHHLQARDRVHLVRLQRAGTAIGFVPLVARPYSTYRVPFVRLSPVSEIFNTHGDLLLGAMNAQAIDALLDTLGGIRTRWDCFRVSKLLNENPVGGLLAERAVARGWRCSRTEGPTAYHLPLPATFEEYFSRRSAKFRNHARRAEKKLRAAGAVAIAEITNASGFEAAYADILHVERASWKESQGVSIHAVPQQTAFYREWGQAAGRAGRLHVQMLTLNGEPIAHNIGYLRRDCYYYLKTSYAAGHRPVGPATFLRLRLIESLMARGVRTIDLPGTPFDWERQWTDTLRAQHAITLYPATVRGRLLHVLERSTRRPALR